MQYNGRGKEKDVGAGEEEQSVWFGKLWVAETDYWCTDSRGGKLSMLRNLGWLNSVFQI